MNKTSTVDSAVTTFRAAMSRLPSPVTVITTRDAHGRPAGATVGAAMSLSLEPRLLMISLTTNSKVAGLLIEQQTFTMSILESSQADLARRFGAPSIDKFVDVVWDDWHGLPRIGGAVAYLHCRSRQQLVLGDHTVFIGEPLDIEIREDGAPLAYADRVLGPVAAPEAIYA